MPVYEYMCQSCGHEFEELARSMSSEDTPTCPACQGKQVGKRLSVFSAKQTQPATKCDMPQGMCGGCCRDAGGPCPLS